MVCWNNCSQQDAAVHEALMRVHGKRGATDYALLLGITEFSDYGRQTGYLPEGGRMWQAMFGAPAGSRVHPNALEYIYLYQGHYLLISWSEQSLWPPEIVLGALLKHRADPDPDARAGMFAPGVLAGGRRPDKNREKKTRRNAT